MNVYLVHYGYGRRQAFTCPVAAEAYLTIVASPNLGVNSEWIETLELHDCEAKNVAHSRNDDERADGGSSGETQHPPAHAG